MPVSFEHIFPLVFLGIMVLNLLSVLALVAVKQVRSSRQRRTREHIARLKSLLETDLVSRTQQSFQVLRNTPSATIRHFLQSLTKSEVGRFRGLLQKAFEKTSDRARFHHELRRKGPWEKSDAILILGVLQDETVLEELSAALRDPNADIANQAMEALGEWDQPQALNPLIQELNSKSRLSPSRVATVLAQCDTDLSENLTRLAQSQDVTSQYWAVSLLEHYATPQSRAAVLGLVASQDENVRIAAMSTLGSIGDSTTDMALVQGLQDRSWKVRVQAAHACGKRRLGAAISLLVACLRDQEWWVRSAAREALENLGPLAVDELLRVLDDRDEFARNMAAMALENMGYVEALLWDLRKQGQAESQAFDTLVHLRRAGLSDSIDRMVNHHHPEAFTRFQSLVAGKSGGIS